jgi:hypothetical protein
LHAAILGGVTEITRKDWRDRADKHAPRSAHHPVLRAAWQYAYDPDEIELACLHCTLVYRDGQWTHDGACPRR